MTSKKASGQDAAKLAPSYVPTEAEATAVETVRIRRAERAAPKVKYKTADGGKGLLMSDHPDGATWDAMVQNAVGTASGETCDWFTTLLINAVPAGSTDEVMTTKVNAVLGIMAGISPRDEIESMLAAQMIATHQASMEAMRRLTASTGDLTVQERRTNMATKLQRTFAAQVEALTRYRNKGKQRVTVEHVHVYPGGKAIVGNVETRGGGGAGVFSEEQSHADGHADAPEPAMRGQDQEGDAVPGRCNGKRTLPDARRH